MTWKIDAAEIEYKHRWEIESQIGEGIKLLRKAKGPDAREAAMDLLARKAKIGEVAGRISCAIVFDEGGDIFVGRGAQCKPLLKARDEAERIVKAFWKWSAMIDAKLKEIKKDDVDPEPGIYQKCGANKVLFYSEDACEKVRELYTSEAVESFYESAYKVIWVLEDLRNKVTSSFIPLRADEIAKCVNLEKGAELCIPLPGLTIEGFSEGPANEENTSRDSSVR